MYNDVWQEALLPVCRLSAPLIGLKSKSKSKSHCDRRPVSMSWCRAQSGTFDQRFFFQSFCLVFFFGRGGAPSLTRGRVCHVSVFVIEVYNSQSLFTTIYIWSLTGLFRCALFIRVRDKLLVVSVPVIFCERPVQCVALGGRGINISAYLESLTPSRRGFHVAGCMIPLPHNPMEPVHTSETSLYFTGLKDIASRKIVQPIYAH
jgi:hypothetical protein